MISLSDDELKIIMDCARPLASPQDRSQFLTDVARALERYEIVGVGIVARVAREAQRKYFAAPTMMHNNSRWNRR
jgi:hypothetical protein